MNIENRIESARKNTNEFKRSRCAKIVARFATVYTSTLTYATLSTHAKISFNNKRSYDISKFRWSTILVRRKI